MIFFIDRQFNTIAVADAHSEEGLTFHDDELNQAISTGTALFKTRIDKSNPDASLIEAGQFVVVPDFKGRSVLLEIIDVSENRNQKTIIAEDAGLELLNADSGPFKLKGHLKDFVFHILGKESSWEIGLDEIGDSRDLTLEYEGHETQTKRLVQVAGRFDAEISYSFNFENNRIKNKYINFHKKRGSEEGVRLEVGQEINDIERTVSIADLRTAVRAVGQKRTETVKKTQTVTKEVSDDGGQEQKEENQTPDKIKKFMGWFESRNGKTRYSMSKRHGPNSFDCSSAVFYAARHAGLIPSNHHVGNTDTLLSSGFRSKYLDEINFNDVRYGDIFVSGRAGASGGAAGHTGAFITKDQIIHSTSSGRGGIQKTPSKGRMGKPPTRYFRWKNAGESTPKKTTTKKSSGQSRYWTNSDLTKHDLGFKLQGLTAEQINNWVKGTSPKSPFNGQGEVFMEAQRQSGLDARYILAHAALESAWGQSNIAKKYNNFFGIGAFDSNPDNARNYSNPGLASGIIEGAKWIAKNYYNGKWKQTTLYKMRHNNGTHQYATDPRWHTKIANVMKGSEKYTNRSALVIDSSVQETRTERPTWPTKEGLPITSGYGPRRAPTAGASTWHAAIDIGGQGKNHPIYATQNGVVTRAGWIQGGGNNIRIRHTGDKYHSQYQHLSRIDVKVGDKVKKGQQIGLMGTTGISTGIHLDFAISTNGTFYRSNTTIDPREYLKMSFKVAVPKGAKVVKEEVVTTEEEIEKETNLIGYDYDDGRFFVDEEGVLCDREANKRWNSALSKENHYIVRYYSSQATSEKTLFDEALRQLRNNNEPKITYEIDLNYLPEEVDIGDTVRIIDHDYNPPLYLNARLVEVTTSLSKRHVNKGVFANFEERASGIYGKLLDLQGQVLSQRYELDKQPFELRLTSTNGNVFKDSLIDTELIATVKRANITQTHVIDRFEWTRQSAYPDKVMKTDAVWNEENRDYHAANLSITADDVDLEATFICQAVIEDTVVAVGTYTIKDLTIGIYKQKEEPDRSKLNWGDVWQWDGEGEEPFKRIWKNGQWEDTVTKRDLELIELMPGPPGQDGERGVPGPPGKDGRTPYIHLAYAESADGVVGFTLTASPGKDYIGLAHSFDPKDPTDPKAYEWSKFTGEDGADGIPGKPGKDGRTPYTHFAYANSADGSKDFSVSDSKDKDYLGVYTDYEKADSQDPKKYHWQLVRGPKGPKGDKGDPGKDGVPGKPGVGIKNTTISYAIGKSATQYPSTGWSAQVPKTTQGDFLWTKMQWSYTDGTRETGYTVSYIAEDGNDGTNGIPGKDGVGIKSSTVHYAKNQSGTQRPGSGWTAQVPETKPGDYLWSRLTLTYDDNTTEEVYNASHIGKDGAKGEKGDKGAKGDRGPKGADGKTGQLGQNLLIKSNELVTTTNYLLAQYDLAEVPEDEEEMTITVKVKEPLNRGWIGLWYGGGNIGLGTLRNRDGNINGIYSNTFKWRSGYGRHKPLGEFVRIYSGPNDPTNGNAEVTLEWAVLARGDIPAIDWYNSYEEMQSQINNKAEQDRVNEIESQQQALEVYVESIPTPEELRRNSAAIARHQAYLDQLTHAITSDKLTLEERIKIIEANVGAGKLSIEAINTYLDFGEEGVLIGKQGEQVKMTLDNDSLEIVDGTKVVARFSNNQSEIVNLKVTGTMEFGHHLVEKLEQGGKRFTTIKPI